jgi:ABC-type methionine transport system ATPase subunit
MASLSVRNVSRLRSARTILDGVSLELPSASICLVMGPSGAGKTTLLRLLNRLEDADAGEIRYGDAPIAALPVTELRRRVVMVLQQPAMFEGSVADNIAFGLRLAGVTQAAELRERANASLLEVGLGSELAARPAVELSVGEQQRVCLARALTLAPEVLLLDEPTAALDGVSADRVLELLSALPARGISIVMVTHQLRHARRMGGASLVLSAGRVAAYGQTREVLERPAVAQLISALEDPRT